MLVKLKYWDNSPSNIKLTVDTTVSILNVMHIDELIKWKVSQQYKKINRYPTNQGLIGMHFLHSPDILNVTVLPKHLKTQVEEKINNLKFWIQQTDTQGKDIIQKYKKLDALVNFMNSQDNSYIWPRTIEYLDKMDNIRQTDWKSVLLEYA